MRIMLLLLLALGGCKALVGAGVDPRSMKKAHPREIEWVGFSGDSSLIVSGSPNELRLWSLEGHLEAKLPGAHSQPVFDQHQQLYAMTQGGLMRLHLAPPWTPKLIPLEGLFLAQHAAVVAAFEDQVAVVAGEQLLVFSPEHPEGAIRHRLENADHSLAASAGARLVLVSIAKDRREKAQIRGFDLAHPDRPPQGLGEGSLPGAPVISPEGRLCALHMDSQLVVFDLQTGKELWRKRSPRNGLRPTGFSAEAAWLFAGDGKFDQFSYEGLSGALGGREAYLPGKQGMWIGTVSAPRAQAIYVREGDRIERFDASMRRVGTLGRHGEYGLQHVPRALVASPDGKWVVVEHAQRLHLWALDGQRVRYLVDERLPSL